MLTLHMIATALEEPFCFYLIALEGTQMNEPLWFEYHEVELVVFPLVDSRTDESALSQNQD